MSLGHSIESLLSIAPAPRPAFVETWKAIAGELHRSERWCRYMAKDEVDPLPVYKVGGIVRMDLADMQDWLDRQRIRH